MKVLLGITGSVAAKLAAKLVDELFVAGHEIMIVQTDNASHFINKLKYEGRILDKPVYTDKDEWKWYNDHGKVLHIDLVKWADVFLIAPCTVNTLTKISLGLCDNLITSCARAWPKDKKVVVALAANTVMLEHPCTAEACACLEVIYPNLAWVRPIEKKLYCGDSGIGAMAKIEDIINAIP